MKRSNHNVILLMLFVWEESFMNDVPRSGCGSTVAMVFRGVKQPAELKRVGRSNLFTDAAPG